jgi:hypothetical protein
MTTDLMQLTSQEATRSDIQGRWDLVENLMFLKGLRQHSKWRVSWDGRNIS